MDKGNREGDTVRCYMHLIGFMRVFSFLKNIAENNTKRILVSFDSTVDGYEIVEDNGYNNLISMDINTCKLKHFEKDVIKKTRREVYKSYPGVNAFVDLNLNFIQDRVIISGKKVFIKKTEDGSVKNNIKFDRNKFIFEDKKNVINNKNTYKKEKVTSTKIRKFQKKKPKKRKRI